MRSYMYKEREYAAAVLTNGFLSHRRGHELRLAALYCKEVFGISRAQCRARLVAICDKYIEGFDERGSYGMINYALRKAYAKDSKLISVESISIYENELAFIDSIPLEANGRRVLFTLLVLWKLARETAVIKGADSGDYNNICWGGDKSRWRELKKTSNTLAEDNIYSIIHELHERRLISIQHSGLITLDFLNGITEVGAATLKITDYSNIGLYYDRVHGDSTIRECELCGGLFRQGKGKRKYCCSECSGEANVIKTRERMKTLRAV